MRQMGLCAIFPKKKTSRPGESTEKSPYLLTQVVISRPNQVWSTDLTYIRLSKGFVCWVAIIDWFSRDVLSWELSNSQDVFCCLTALEKALCFGKPDIFNSVKGSQFTSEALTRRLRRAEIAISRDGRGRVFDNICVERLWRTVKYEEVILNDYQSVTDARVGLENAFNFYQRLHPVRYPTIGCLQMSADLSHGVNQSLNSLTPQQVHFGKNS